jgi:hypothetical protein
LFELCLRHPFDFCADLPDLFCQGCATTRDIFQHYLFNEARNRIQVAGKGFTPNAQRLKWNSASPRERVHDERDAFGVRCTDQAAAHSQKGRLRCKIPISEFPNEAQERSLEILVTVADFAWDSS